MAKELNTNIEIDAPANVVWEALTDFSRYSQWNPFIRLIRGIAKQGEQLEIFIQPPGGREMTAHPVILDLKPEHELCWVGKLLLPGIFDAEHHFQIEPLGESQTRLLNREVYTGLLVSLLWQEIDTKIRQGFEEMNHALKTWVEKK
jgi:hypothetical protein